MDPAKDADGLHPTNLGRLVLGEPGPLPCTPRGCVELLRRYGVPLEGAEVVVVGRGVTVGRPIGLLLTRRSENATVTLCHTGTRDLATHLRGADVVIAAAGVPGLIKADDLKPGAAVLDVGITADRGRPGRRRRARRRVGGRFPRPGARRRGPDDPRDAAAERGRSGRVRRLTGSAVRADRIGSAGAGARRHRAGQRRRERRTLPVCRRGPVLGPAVRRPRPRARGPGPRVAAARHRPDHLVRQPRPPVHTFGDGELGVQPQQVLLDRGLGDHQLVGDLPGRRGGDERLLGQRRPAEAVRTSSSRRVSSGATTRRSSTVSRLEVWTGAMPPARSGPCRG